MNVLDGIKSFFRKDASQVVEGQLPPVINRRVGKFPEFSAQVGARSNHGWVYIASQRNAAGIGAAKLRLYATTGTGEKAPRVKYKAVSGTVIQRLERSPHAKALRNASDVVEILQHPVLDLLDKVNPHQNGFELREMTSNFIDLCGNCYWHTPRNGINGIPTEIWPVPAQYMRIVPSKEKFIECYLYGRSRADMIEFDPSEIIHFTRPNINDSWYGLSRIEAAWWAVSGYTEIEAYEQNLLSNAGIQNFIVNYKKGSLTPAQRRDLQASFATAFAIAGKSRAPLIADEDFDIKPMEWSPREIGFLNGRQWRKEEILAAFGQSVALHDKDTNRANIDGAIYLWESYELTPTLTRIEQKMNEQLLPMYQEPRLFFAFDPIVDDDKAFALQQETADLTAGVRTINEVRTTRGLEPVDWGDVPFVNAAPAPAFPMSLSARAPSRRKSTAFFHNAASKAADDADEALTGGPNPALSKAERKIAAAVKPVFADQAAAAQVRAIADDDFSWLLDKKWNERIANAIVDPLKSEYFAGVKVGEKLSGVGGTAFIEHESTGIALEKYSLKLAGNINEVTVDQLKATMKEGVDAGENVQQLKKRIEALNQEQWQGYRAERIARTESARARMAGVEAQWKESGVVTGKEWDASADACPFCLEMHGKVMPLGENYHDKGGELGADFEGERISMSFGYDAIQYPPLHPGCRCAMLPVIDDEMTEDELRAAGGTNEDVAALNRI